MPRPRQCSSWHTRAASASTTTRCMLLHFAPAGTAAVPGDARPPYPCTISSSNNCHVRTQILNVIRSTLGQPVFYRDVWGVVKGHVSEVIHEEGGLLFENSHTLGMPRGREDEKRTAITPRPRRQHM